MASTASSSRGPQLSEAGPLPRKVGEFGYPSSASLHQPESEADITESAELPARHPADRPDPVQPPSRTQPTPAQSTAAGSSTTSLQSTIPPKRSGLLYRLRSSRAPPLFWGLHGPAVIRFVLILFMICGTITGWALTAGRLGDANARNDNGTAAKNDMLAQMAGTMGIFVHVAFAVALLIELVFIERAIFQLRAERWLYKHPGEALPLHRGGRGSSAGGVGMNYAPWNRPPLPTYASALGYRGTGDPEDDAIAAPPPPAYGNTRGSVLLLSNALRRISHLSQQMSPRTPRDFEQIPESRPVSYVSAAHDDPETRSAAERARQLEVTLARLEQQQ
ncbi:hypothetical protein EXIGLDRAFT_385882 [Exidia glandulosa HHB12029]|uniref:Uncharacterized protein n=1 Tax=Exidia glandulosa HHB12029 TaxID=1314781 RepID=A0A165BVM1_EXIGL|nr:hypothetical protein EXIGLDRAFT_385882 [Exidia glandulosa HHB12029]